MNNGSNSYLDTLDTLVKEYENLNGDKNDKMYMNAKEFIDLFDSWMKNISIIHNIIMNSKNSNDTVNPFDYEEMKNKPSISGISKSKRVDRNLVAQYITAYLNLCNNLGRFNSLNGMFKNGQMIKSLESRIKNLKLPQKNSENFMDQSISQEKIETPVLEDNSLSMQMQPTKDNSINDLLGKLKDIQGNEKLNTIRDIIKQCNGNGLEIKNSSILNKFSKYLTAYINVVECNNILNNSQVKPSESNYFEFYYNRKCFYINNEYKDMFSTYKDSINILNNTNFSNDFKDLYEDLKNYNKGRTNLLRNLAQSEQMINDFSEVQLGSSQIIDVPSSSLTEATVIPDIISTPNLVNEEVDNKPTFVDTVVEPVEDKQKGSFYRAEDGVLHDLNRELRNRPVFDVANEQLIGNFEDFVDSIPENQQTSDDPVWYNNSKKPEESNSNLMKVTNVKKSKNKKGLMAKIIAATIGLVMILSPVVGRLFNSSNSKDTEKIIESSISSKIEDGNVNNISIEDEAAKVAEQIQGSTIAYDKVDDTKSEISDDEHKYGFKLGDEVTFTGDAYDNVYSAADKTDGLNPYYDADHVYKTSGAFLENNGDYLYTLDQSTLDDYANKGYDVVSYVLSNQDENGKYVPVVAVNSDQVQQAQEGGKTR